MDTSGLVELDRYNPIRDPHLSAYFKSQTVQKHLRKIGLIDENGEYLSSPEIKKLDVRGRQELQSNEQVTKQFVTRSNDFQLGRQLELQRQLDAVSKVQVYRHVKGTEVGPNGMKLKPSELDKSFRSRSLPPTEREDTEPRRSSGYATDEESGRQKIRRGRRQISAAKARKNHLARYMDDVHKFQVLHKLDLQSLKKYKNYLHKELREIKKVRDTLPTISPESTLSSASSWRRYRRMSTPDLPSKSTLKNSLVPLTKSSKGSANRARSHGSRFSRSMPNGGASSLPPLSAKSKVGKMVDRLYVTSGKSKATNATKRQPMSVCFLQYLGANASRSADTMEGEIDPNTTELTIQQQHCGGNPIIVFKENLVHGAIFYFFSYRHVGFSFSLSLIQNGEVVSRLSTCCESRYVPNSYVGSKQCKLKWLGIRNGLPCYKCQLDRDLQPPYTNYEPSDETMLQSVIEKEQLLANNRTLRPSTTLPLAAARVPKPPPGHARKPPFSRRFQKQAQKPPKPAPKKQKLPVKNKTEETKEKEAEEDSNSAKTTDSETSQSEDSESDQTSDSESDSAASSASSAADAPPTNKAAGDNKSVEEDKASEPEYKWLDDLIASDEPNAHKQATKIQSIYRGYRTRKELKATKKETSQTSLDDHVETDDLPDRLQRASSALLALEDKFFGEPEKKEQTGEKKKDGESSKAEDKKEEASDSESSSEDEESKSESKKSEKKEESDSEDEESKSELKKSTKQEASDSETEKPKDEKSEEAKEKPMPKAVLERRQSQIALGTNRKVSRKESNKSGTSADDESESDESDSLWLCKVCNFENATDQDKCWICKEDKGAEPQSAKSDSDEESTATNATKSEQSKADEDSDSDTETESRSKWPDAKSSSEEESETEKSKSATSDKKSKESEEEDEDSDTEKAESEGKAAKSKESSEESDSSEESEDDKDTLADAQSIRSEPEEPKQASGGMLGPPDITVQPATPSGEKQMMVQESGAPSSTSESRQSAVTPEPDSLEAKCGQPEVSLSGTDLSDLEVARRVTALLSDNRQLKSLSLRSTEMSDDTWKLLVQRLEANKAPIKVLNLSDNHLTSESAEATTTFVEGHPVEILMMHDNQLGDDGLTELLDGLIEVCGQKPDTVVLRRLDIGENRMGDQAAQELANLLRVCPSLKSVNLGGNSQLNTESWGAIAEALGSHPAIEALNLDYCQMGDDGVELICKALKGKSSLKFIDLEGNNIGDRGISFLIDTARTCVNLQNVLFTAGNNVSGDRQKQLQLILNAKQAPATQKDFLGLKPIDYAK